MSSKHEWEDALERYRPLFAEQQRKLEAVKRRYGPLFAELTALFFRVDPGHLASAPQDEYEPEVGTVLPRLHEARSAADVRAILDQEFIQWFGPSEFTQGFEPDRVGRLADELWSIWLDWKTTDSDGKGELEG
jgi:hypothetical protein